MRQDDAIAVQARSVVQRFYRDDAVPPSHAVAAPGRVNLIGEHTDYNGGRVLPMAIERWTLIAARPRDDQRVRVRTTEAAAHNEATIDLTKPIEPGEPAWANYVRGVIAGWQEQHALADGFDAVIDSCVPIGGGLSSSASLTVACATLLESLTGKPYQDPLDKALLAQRAENHFAGVPCGLMDPLASAAAQLGHGMLIDFSDTSIRHIALPKQLAVIITHCNKPHALVGGEYAARRTQCESAAAKLGVNTLSQADTSLLRAKAQLLLPVERQRAMHVIEENERVLRFAEALKNHDWPTIGSCMYDSHASMRDLFEITTPELDTLVDLAAAIGPGGGVIGSRMTGGGFGGCTVTLAFAKQANEVCEKLAADYEDATGLATQPFVTNAAEGARTLDLASMS